VSPGDGLPEPECVSNGINKNISVRERDTSPFYLHYNLEKYDK
jgi:hypothetical protein